jgi:signal transduction histidine kinase
VKQLDAQIATMQSMLERELKLARLAGSGPSSAGFRPEEDMQGLIAVMEKIYPHVAIAIQHHAPGQMVCPFDREDIMECLGNLLDNACKWCKTTVSVKVDASQGLVITIEDDGPGCSQDQLEKLGTRGLRLDESVIGHGLGLSICRDIVSYYQGLLEFSRSAELKGLQVRMELALNQSNRPSTDK